MNQKFFKDVIWLGILLVLATTIHGGQKAEPVTFKSGSFDISGTLILPHSQGAFPLLIFVHGDGRGTKTMYAPLVSRFLDTGIACFCSDKPGYGDSRGKFTRGKILAQRAQIVADSIQLLKKHKNILAGKIGLWGISQAGWVMPLAMKKNKDIAFMIVVNGGACDSISQSAFQLRENLMCEGYEKKRALELEKYYIKMMKAQKYEVYLENVRPLIKESLVREMGFVWKEPWPRDRWQANPPDGEAFFNPLGLVKEMKIPILAMFGAKDTLCPPLTGSRDYKKVIEKGGNPLSRVVMIAGGDHSMVLSETGCVKERKKRRGFQWYNYAPGYIDTMLHWLQKILNPPPGP